MNVALTSATLAYDRNEVISSLSDKVLAYQIQVNLYKIPDYDKQAHISATVLNKIVLLTGTTKDPAFKTQAESLARGLKDVRYVVNAITVTNRLHHDSFAEDTWISTKLNTKVILSSLINPNNIKVVTTDHVVYLMGTVYKKQAEELVQLARETNGVKKVVTAFEYITFQKSPAG